MADLPKDAPFAAFPDQRFDSFQEWVSRASAWLTSHPDYFDANVGDAPGWRGHHFTAMCFDQQGRRCRNGGDFMRARDEDAFPVWWIWPDQICDLIMPDRAATAGGV